MDPVISIRPLLAVAVAGLAALAVLLLNNREKLRDVVSPLAAIAMFAIVASMAPTVLAGGTVDLRLFEILPGIDFAFRADALGMVFATVSSLLWIVAAIYSIGYMRHLNEHAQTRFFACFATSLAAAVGGAFAANLFTLVIFYEVLSLVTYPLVYHHEDEEGWTGSRKYLVYLMGASKSVLLAALALTYHIAGSLDFVAGGLLAGVDASAALLTVVYFCYLFGFAKAAVMPMHAWLPAAMVAPTPVSALLHAVAVVKMGVFCVLRVVFHVFGTGLVDGLGLGIATAYLVSFTILMASIYALTRDDLKAQARLFDGQPALLHRAGRGSAVAGRDGRRDHPHCGACILQDHALFLRRVDLLRVWQAEHQRHGRHRPQAALDDGGVLRRLAQHDRDAADRGLRQQVVSGAGLGGGGGDRVPDRAPGEFGPERRLFPAGQLCRLFRDGGAGEPCDGP